MNVYEFCFTDGDGEERTQLAAAPNVIIALTDLCSTDEHAVNAIQSIRKLGQLHYISSQGVTACAT